MKIGEAKVYGFGERMRGFDLGQGAWTMWSQEGTGEYDDGRGGKQQAGMHPFALIKIDNSDEFFGIFFRNTNAQSPIISYQEGQKVLSYVTTGGNLDINFFGRGTAKEVISNYQQFIGLPKLPPFWALGWHATSPSWINITYVKDYVKNYTDNNYPLEILWLNGLNYMDGGADFTVNPKEYAGLKEYTGALHSWGKKLVLMLYPGFSNDKPSKYITAAEGALIRGFNGSKEDFEVPTLYSQNTKFLDWFHINSSGVWEEGLFDLYKQVEYDGLWLDMNTPTIACNGGQPCPEPSKTTKHPMVKSTEEADADVSWYQSFGSDFQGEKSTYYLPFIP